MKRRAMAKAKLETTRWDVIDSLDSDEKIAAYLEAALEDGDPQLVTAAIGDIARARGMTQLARDTGLTREGLYKAFGPNGNPSFATVMKVARALGVKLIAQPA
jgi:probable addiction module antidote protein